MTELRTERLILRRARLEDAAGLHAIFADPRAMTYWSELPHASLDYTAGKVARMVEDIGTADDFIVEKDGRIVGKAGSWKLPEIGYILHPDVWGQGVAREAMTAIISHLFAAHAMPALIADVDPNNEGSVGLLKKLGFTETHRAVNTYFIGGKWSDSVYFALAREAWPAV